MTETLHEKVEDNSAIIRHTSEVISAYVSNNSVSAEELGVLIKDVFGAFKSVEVNASGKAMSTQKPAVNPKKSVFPDYIICLEDGKKFKSLKRHLTAHFGLTPQEYREKWGLPVDYPMVAPSYSERRSNLAREKGLGRKKNNTAAA
ncbi:MAG: MucR family transcriptional regulator [Rhizobiales bacterium]|nr:MucR family transcriptional regulator [Hyphomicrobiales bacterium]